MMRVAFQGEVGAYSEEAIYQYFSEHVEVEPCKSLKDVFKITDGKVEYAVVPIENSLEGSINQTYDLLLSHNLKVSGEINLRIVHCLISNRKAKLSDIKTVYSHPQALGQCKTFIEILKAETISTYDTAGSVKMLMRSKETNAAAIASEKAAKIYGMKILAKGIEDDENNYTRFFVLSKKDAPPSGDDKTSIAFSLKHVPGALYRSVEEFAVRKINLTKIESRPTKKRPWEYNFYLDFEGHRTETRCREALRALENNSLFVKVLGSYPKARELNNTII